MSLSLHMEIIIYRGNYYYLVKEGEDVLEARQLIWTYVWTVREPEVQQRLRGIYIIWEIIIYRGNYYYR